MGKKSIKIYIAFLFTILFLGIASAEYNLGSPVYEIETTYNSGQGISGWISIQFINASNSTLFEDSEGNSMTLLELLNENSNFIYTINSTYGTIDSSTLQNLYLDETVFKVSQTEGNFSYQFNFSGQEIFTEQINVLSSSQSLNDSINSKIEKINELQLDLEQYDEFEKLSLNSAINLSQLKQELINLSLEYSSAITQEELAVISSKLEAIRIPDDIFITKTADSLVIFPSVKYISLEAVEEISNSTYEQGEEEKYKIVILDWVVNYLDIKISFNEFSAYYNRIPETAVNVFNLSVIKKNNLEYPFYLFIREKSNLLVEQNYQEQINYYVFEINENSKNIRFSSTENINFTNIDFFISPPLNELSLENFEYVEGGSKEDDLEKRKWTIFVLIMILLLIFGFIIYLILQKWYKRRYEEYLFPNKNDLFNLANYISNSKKRGLDNEQIRDNLIKARWSSEQIRYALRKYSGRRTGMYEIAMRKTLEKNNSKAPPKFGFQNFPPK